MTQPLLTALVFDNEVLDESVAVEVLARSGCVVQHATSLADLRRRAAATPPTVLVLDLEAAGPEGLNVIRELHRHYENAAIAVLSPFPAHREEVLAAGAWELIDPSDPHVLEGLINSLRAATRSDWLETGTPAYPAEPQP